MTKGPVRRESLGNGVFFSTISENRFKSNLLAVHFLLPIDEGQASSLALVPMMLEKCSEKYPRYRFLSRRLDALYGAYIGGNMSKYGDRFVVTFYASVIENRYALQKEDLLKESAALLSEVIFHPLRDEEGLDYQNFSLQKEYLMDSIRSQINDKRRYALNRLIEKMYQGERYGVFPGGTLKQAEAVTARDVTDSYNRMLKEASVEIFYTGDTDPEAAKAIFRECFSKERTPVNIPKTDFSVSRETPFLIKERMDVTQGKLCIGVKTGISSDDPRLSALRVGVNLLGGNPASKFFLHIRERDNLCYYCLARLDRLKGFLIFDSGVDSKNIPAAKQAILKEFSAVQNGEITDEEIAAAKLALCNSFRSVGENIYSLSSYYLTQLFSETIQTPDEACRQIESVTKKEISDLFSKLRIDGTFILTGEGYEHENDL